MASAVVVADDSERSPSANGLKRRASDVQDVSEQEQESKRQRMSPGKISPTAEPSTHDDGSERSESRPGNTHEEKPPDSPVDTQHGEPTRRKTGPTMHDKQRSKRLFGALLGNLNQPGDRASKRRQEIESRRKAELQRQDDERLEDKKQRLEKLAEKRKETQREVDEKNVGGQPICSVCTAVLTKCDTDAHTTREHTELGELSPDDHRA